MPTAPPPEQAAPFPKSFGDYELLEEVARGSMGVVYRARQLSLDRVVAVKTILPERLGDEAQVRRFRAEAQAAGRLRHPGIVRFHEVGVCDGQHFFSMDYVDGESLADRVAAGPVEPRTAAGWVRDVADAVAAAHRDGVLHRDLKPGNILLDREGSTWVTDFGLAKDLSTDVEETAPGVVLGTANYMSPEQAAGRVDAVGPASDVYSLGAVLYALLAGRPPFVAPGFLSTLRQVEQREPIPIGVLQPGVPRDLQTICHACLQKAPGRRYAGARELSEDLQRFLDGRPIRARPVSRAEKAVLWCRRRPLVAGLAAGVLVVALAGATGVTVAWRRAVSALDRAERAERAEATSRLEALASARPEALAALSASIDPRQPAVAAAIEGVLGRPDLSDGARLRMHLVRLAVAPEGLEEVGPRLLGLELSELVAVRDALAARREAVPAAAWDSLGSALGRIAADAGAAPESRIASAVALAALDPERCPWDDVADEAVDRMLACPTLEYPVWLDALRPVRHRLVGALRNAFSDETRSEDGRLRAATALAEYTEHRPELLAELAVEATPRTLEELMPGLVRHPDAVLPLLDAVLAEEPVAEWPRTALRGDEPAADVASVRAIEAASGWVAETFALAHALDLAAVAARTEALRAAGYRPVRVRPWQDGGELRAAVVWRRDGREWRLAAGLDTAGARARVRDWAAAGLRPVDVSGWADPEDGRPRFVLVAVRAGADDPDVQVQVGATLDEADAEARRLEIANYSAETHHVTVLDGDLRVSRIWRQHPRAVEQVPGRLTGAATLTRWPLPSLTVLDVQVRPREGGPRYAVCAREDPLLAAETLVEDGVAAHLEACRRAAAAGRRPAAISVEPAAGGEMRCASVWHVPVVTAPLRSASARRRANAGIVAARLRGAAQLEPLLGDAATEVRARVVRDVRLSGARPEDLVEMLSAASGPALRFELLRALGTVGTSPGPAGLARIRALHRDDPDPGVHAAAGWTLRRLGHEPVRAAAPLSPDRGWYRDGEGHTLAVVRGPVEFDMGSPGSEPGRRLSESLHRRYVPRSFAVATREVTVAQFERFLADRPDLRLANPGLSPDLPAVRVDWWTAGQYCRWLSEREGLPEAQMCFPRHAGAGPCELPPDYLTRTGYRLPTEAEWEYAARAGAAESRYFGDGEDLVPAYAWCAGNATGVRPVGLLPPNRLGLFDVFGNAFEWTLSPAEPFDEPGSTVTDREVDFAAVTEFRILRGGSFEDGPEVLRAANRPQFHPDSRGTTVGFRVARTVPD